MGRSLGKTIARNLKRLIDSEEINSSDLHPEIIDELTEMGCVETFRVGSGRKVRCKGNLRSAIQHVWGISDLEAYLSNESPTRAESVKIASDTKAFGAKPLNGVHIRAFGGATATLNNTQLQAPPQGAHIIVSKRSTQFLKTDAQAIVISENGEPMDYFETAIEKLDTYLLPSKLCLVYRNPAGLEWASSTKLPIFHFGDFDPAGIAIFRDQILKINSEAKILLPLGYETLISNGNPELYDTHIRYVKRLISSVHPEISKAIQPIQKYGRGLEQEALLDT